MTSTIGECFPSRGAKQPTNCNEFFFCDQTARIERTIDVSVNAIACGFDELRYVEARLFE